MAMSLFNRTAALSCCLAAGLVPGLAQSQYPASGSEYPPAGKLAGNQTLPRLAIDAHGGLLVWEDNNADGKGLGVRAIALDSALQAAQVPYRVNATAIGDQEKPSVALGANGGAAFVWQGGVDRIQNIYGRFLTASNTWAGGDVLLSTPGRIQRNPSVVGLANGNFAVVYSSYNQASSNSYFDVYAQVVSPAGAKVGQEFRVSQSLSFNQRTPAAAALKDGRLVVAWISEDQRGSNTVDVVARLFDAAGTPAGSEFVVNTSDRLCANPAVAATETGFVVGWSVKNPAVRDEGWDVMVRSLTLALEGGVEQKINTRTLGDQLAPQLGAVPGAVMALWTSFGQDGDRDGIYGRLLNTDGTPAEAEFCVNTRTVGRQMHPVLAADGLSRFLGVWSTYTTGTSEFDLAGQVYAPAGYLPIAATTNYSVPVYVAANPGGDVVQPLLDAPESLNNDWSVQPDGWAKAPGYYSGLFYHPEGINPASSGWFSLTTTARKTFSGRFIQAGVVYPVSGTFDAEGKVTRTVKLLTGQTLTVSLQINLAGEDIIRGTVSRHNWQAQVFGYRSAFTTKAPCPLAGTYTMLIPPDDDSVNSPGGFGYATVKVSSNGSVACTARLADGTVVTQSRSVAANGIWSLYAYPYSARGVNLGWIQIQTNDLSGEFVWIRPARQPGRFFSAGFTNMVEVTGSRYSVPPTGTRVVNWSSPLGKIELSGGGLPAPVTQWILLGSGTGVTTTEGKPLDLTIDRSVGTFYGNVRHPSTGALLPVKGKFIQDEACGAGYFSSTLGIGQVHIVPADLP